jgi:hypothetical protein
MAGLERGVFGNRRRCNAPKFRKGAGVRLPNSGGGVLKSVTKETKLLALRVIVRARKLGWLAILMMANGREKCLGGISER